MGDCPHRRMLPQELGSPVAAPNSAVSRIGETAGGRRAKIEQREEIQIDETFN